MELYFTQQFLSKVKRWKAGAWLTGGEELCSEENLAALLSLPCFKMGSPSESDAVCAGSARLVEHVAVGGDKLPAVKPRWGRE